MYQLNTLPDDHLLHIFDRVPLMDLLCLDQVCQRWLALLPSALCRRRSLTLLVSDLTSSVRYYDFRIPFSTEVVLDAMPPIYLPPARQFVSALTLPDLRPNESDWTDRFMDYSVGYFAGIFDNLWDDSELFTQMARLKHARMSGQLSQWLTLHFTNVHSLTVVHPNCTQMELLQLVNLMTFWQTTLVNSLKLWLRILTGNYDHFESEFKLYPDLLLLSAIARLPLLKHRMTLDISNDDEPDVRLRIPQDFLLDISSGRMVELYFGTYYVIKPTISLPPGLLHLGFGDSRLDLSDLEAQLLSFAPKVTIRHLHFPDFPQQRIFNSDRFKSLNLLRINWPVELSFTELATNLSLLAQLSHLQLDIHFALLPPRPFEQPSNAQLMSLPQIKILHLKIIQQYSHLDFQSLSPLVFPSVNMATVVVHRHCIVHENQCRVCKRFFNSAILTNQQVIQCRKMMFHSLESKLPALIRLYYKRNHFEVDYRDWFADGHGEDIEPGELSLIVDDLKAEDSNPTGFDASRIRQLIREHIGEH